MARAPLIKPERVDEPIKDIFDWVIEMENAIPNHFYLELNFPEFMKVKLDATKVFWSMGELTMPEIQHIGILVSKQNGCPLVTLLVNYFNLRPIGVFIAIPIAETFIALMAWYFFKKGRWKKVQL